jgi:N-acetylmuramoyl-L-alanine amidase
LLLTPGRGVVTYYASAGFVSPGGYALACRLGARLGSVPGLALDSPTGMRLTALRETRMPAVLCELGPSEVVVSAGGQICRELARAVEEWAGAPVVDS